jgi:asparagine synthase (glutamine-hydrolysing)
MQSWTDAMDEPPANIVNLLWFTAILNRGAEERIGVMLEGVGGNITISWHTWTVLGYLFNRGRWPALVRTINALHKRGAVSMKTAIRYTTRSLVPHVVNRRLLSYAWVDRDLPLLNPDWMRRFHIREKIFDTLYNRPTDLAAERSLPFAHYDSGPLRVASEVLTGIELRDPTADKRVYEYCFSIPPEQYVAGGLTRSLARRAAKDRLPDSVRLRESRGLQGADWHIPMTESLPSLRHEFSLIEQSPIAQEALDLRAIRELLYNWPSGGFHTPEVYSRYHYALAPAMSLGYFLRTHDGSRANAVTAAHTTSVPQSAV